MIREAADYEQLCREFRWPIPEFYNIGVDVCDRHADGAGRLALIFAEESGAIRRCSFDELRRVTNRFANVLAEHGFQRGDRLAVFMPQSLETAIGHIAAFKSGLISVPLFALFGEEALTFRLADSGAKGVVTDRAGMEKLLPLRDKLPELGRIYVAGSDPTPAGCVALESALERASENFTPARTRADDPAVIIYTSGTTGNPKGALHAHRVLLGHLPGVELPHDFFPQPGDLMWTPADWAWIGGLFDVLLPSLHHGVPVLAHRARKFDPADTYRLMAEHEVRNTFLPPTALKLLRQSGAASKGVRLRTIASGGETLGAELLDWARATFGLPLQEFYGQTECNLVAGNCARLFPIRPGSLGRPYPGHDLRIVDENGTELADGSGRHHRDKAARSGDVPRVLEQSGGHGREVRRRVPAHGRYGPARCGRLSLVLRAVR